MIVEKQNNRRIRNPGVSKKSVKKVNADNKLPDIIAYGILGVIIIYTVVLYSKSIYNGFNWDDKKYLLTNDLILNFSWKGVKDIFKISSSILGTYQPVTTLSWLIEYKFWGMSAEAFHRTNLILHLLNIILVFIFIRLFTGNNIISLLTSFFFSIHPFHVESVAWNSERKDVLYGFFFLLSLITYLVYLRNDYKIKYIVLSFLFYGLSVLSKSMAITLPLILLIIDYYNDRKILSTRNIIEKVPFFILLLIFIKVTLNTQSGGILDLSGSYSDFNRIFLIPYGIAYYLVKFIFPFKLSAIHPFPLINNHFLPFEYYLSLFFIFFILWLIIKFNRGRKYLIFGTLFFIITLLPVIQIIPFGLAVVSERYTYIPYLGLFIIIFTIIDRSIIYKYPLYILLAVFSIYYSFMTWKRIEVWKSPVTLWEDNVSKYPDYYLGYYKLGGAWESEKNYSKQIECYSKSIELNPTFYNAFNDRGMVKSNLGDFKSAIDDYNSAISINPEYYEAYNNRGMARNNTGNVNGAIDDFNKSVLFNPSYYEAYNNRGWVYFSINKTNEAIADYKMAIYLNNNFLTAHKNLGWAYFNQKNYDEAIKYYSNAINISSEDGQSYQFRGMSYFYVNRIAEACKDWQKAKESGRTDADEYLAKYCR